MCDELRSRDARLPFFLLGAIATLVQRPRRRRFGDFDSPRSSVLHVNPPPETQQRPSSRHPMIPPSFPSCFRKHRSTLRRAPSPSMERQSLSADGYHKLLAHGNIASLLCAQRPRMFFFCLLARNWGICRATPLPSLCGAATHVTGGGRNHNKKLLLRNSCCGRRITSKV